MKNSSDIKSIQNFLPEDILNKIDDQIIKNRWGYGWKSDTTIAFGHWHIEYNLSPERSINENALGIEEYVPPILLEAWNYIKTNHLPDYRLIRCYCNAHTFGTEGHPHYDSNRDGDRTVVIYLNKKWDCSMGGETMFYEDNREEVIHAELPKRNKAVIFPGNILHTATGVARLCPDLRMTLMFKAVAPEYFDKDRDTLQLFLQAKGTHLIKHSATTFCGHLLRTYDLLKKYGMNKDVCLAGGLHSIFGTNAFKQVTVPLEEKNKLIDLFGEKAVHLAELFSKIDRPRTLERILVNPVSFLTDPQGNKIDVTEQEIQDLIAIECVNLYDQKSLNYWTHLTKRGKEIFKNN